MRRIVVPLLAPIALLAACSAGDPAEPTPNPTPVVEQSPSEAASADSEEPKADADLDLQDGIRTNDFGRMPTEIEGMRQVSKETNPGEHSATLVYEGPDGQEMAQFMANFPYVDGEASPLHDTDNESYREQIEGAVSNYEESGSEVDQRSVSAGGMDWDCVEGVGADNVDKTLCVSLRYGRVIDVQYITVHDDDADAWRQAVDDVLGAVGDALVDLA